MTFMRRTLNILALFLFVVGMVVAPAAHVAASAASQHDGCCPGGCQDRPAEPAKHDADHCPICQLAQTPFAVTVPVVAPVAVAVIAECVLLPASAPNCRADRALPFACGPPA